MTLNRVLLALLVFAPITIIADWLGAGSVPLFICSAIAIVPLAKFLSDSTEELASHAGPAVGGLLNATFGNATELIIGLFALSAGLVNVVKASIVGSILGNLLFVFGLAIWAGGIGRTQQTFNVTAARANASVLLLAATALVIPGIFFLSAGSTAFSVEELSLAVAVLMIIGYGANLLFSLHTHKHLYVSDGGEHLAPARSFGVNIGILVVSTIAIAVLSEILVGAIEPLIVGFGWTELFVGAVIIAIVGNAAEHVSAVTVAIRDKMDLALQISMGSATQVLMLVTPMLVIAGAFFPEKMTLVLSPFELAALVFAIFISNSVIEDGETNWFEGVQLLIVYLIIAVAFFLLP